MSTCTRSTRPSRRTWPRSSPGCRNLRAQEARRSTRRTSSRCQLEPRRHAREPLPHPHLLCRFHLSVELSVCEVSRANVAVSVLALSQLCWCDGQAFEREGGATKRSSGRLRQFVPLDGCFHELTHADYGYVETWWDCFYSWAVGILGREKSTLPGLDPWLLDSTHVNPMTGVRIPVRQPEKFNKPSTRTRQPTTRSLSPSARWPSLACFSSI